ncbi:MAG: SGNH/GDSL hydrolase family protein [Cyanobacteria bacterium P01_G01_bin.39]
MKISLIILASVAGLTVVAEIALRLIMGLGNPPLYVADPEIGYLLAPNQKLRRSGNLIETNQYSMRNQELPAQSDEQRRILLLGDSVVNGSWWTDQAETLSSLLTNKLQQDAERTTVLNASANSWGPQNELAYLRRFGLFDAKALVLIINTDDLDAVEPHSLVVGNSYSYPEQPPALALIEFYQLYIAEPKSIPELEQLQEANTDRLSQNLAAIKEIKAIADANQMQFILALTPLRQEFQQDLSESEQNARKRLQELVQAENINYLDFLKIWRDFPQPEFLYRDQIHPSAQGNSKIVEAIAKELIITK